MVIIDIVDEESSHPMFRQANGKTRARDQERIAGFNDRGRGGAGIVGGLP